LGRIGKCFKEGLVRTYAIEHRDHWAIEIAQQWGPPRHHVEYSVVLTVAQAMGYFLTSLREGY